MSNPGDYTVGWICALNTEAVAATVLLDEQHEAPESVKKNDNNHYTLGKVGKHNVVIAVLADGEYGIASAASVARDMMHSFPNVRIGLMVGIGGGAPSQKHDIHLGDIVVSAPRNGNGGVFQYDFGKTIQDQHFRQTGFLNQPPTVLRTAVNALQTQYKIDGHRLQETINGILEKKKRLEKEYARPDSRGDRLYQSGFVHPPSNEESCAAVCGESNLKIRQERTEVDDDPTIHYGLIASANQLMKDASVRDMLAEEKGVLCFEMEAAGLMNHFPCLVIRGICDYSDSHKNKEWQGYSAMAAAAYAKDLLGKIHPNAVEAEKSIQDIMSSVEKGVNEIRDAAQGITYDVKNLGAEHKHGRIKGWLQPPDPSKVHNKALPQRHKDSGRWFLDSEAFAQWKIQRNSFLWLYGIPGCGKTILSSTIIRELDSMESFRPMLYFYFTFAETDKQSLDSMIRSLIDQLYSKCSDARKELDSLFSACGDGHQQPTTESLCTTFLQMVEQVGEVWIVLDALDECHTSKGKRTKGMLSWIRELLSSEKGTVHILMTSRPEQDIESDVRQWARDDNLVPIQGDDVSNDIRAYIYTRIREDDDLKRWRSRPEVQNEIEARLMEKADGMFRWAACQLDALTDCLDYELLTTALESLPKTLDETYGRILDSIPESYQYRATRILQLLAISERPLRIEEAVDAVAVDPKGPQYFNARNRMPEPREISRYCSSLVVVASIQRKPLNGEDYEEIVLQLAHFSVKEYLTSNRIKTEFQQVFQEKIANGSIATVCLAYLLHVDEDFPLPELRRAFPFAQFCAQYWMKHAAGSKEQDEKLRCLALDFFLSKKSYTNCYRLYDLDQCWGMISPRRETSPPTALSYASFGGLKHVVGDLIQQGADVNTQGGKFGNALQAGSVQGYDKIVKLLLSNGANVNAQGGHYGNALQAASWGGYDKTVKLLLSKGANVNAQGGHYGNALQAASWGGHDKTVKLLLSKGANVNAQGRYFGNALQAASKKGYSMIAEPLLSKGANVNTEGGNFGNALQAASSSGDDKIFELILSNSANIHAEGGIYGNALEVASAEGHYKIVELLLSKGANANAKGGWFSNALQAASQGGHYETVELLLCKGANVNAEGRWFSNALQAASVGGHEKIVKLLRSKGAIFMSEEGTLARQRKRRRID
ncbi:MAG: hypothetical protein M1816_003868 [Peltula sp. TS41687]|nr:MAG: hypothetical protein M1816_003868 [Peltula sp. TS41687]